MSLRIRITAAALVVATVISSQVDAATRPRTSSSVSASASSIALRAVNQMTMTAEGTVAKMEAGRDAGLDLLDFFVYLDATDDQMDHVIDVVTVQLDVQAESGLGRIDWIAARAGRDLDDRDAGPNLDRRVELARLAAHDTVIRNRDEIFDGLVFKARSYKRDQSLDEFDGCDADVWGIATSEFIVIAGADAVSVSPGSTLDPLLGTVVSDRVVVPTARVVRLDELLPYVGKWVLNAIPDEIAMRDTTYIVIETSSFDADALRIVTRADDPLQPARTEYIWNLSVGPQP